MTPEEAQVKVRSLYQTILGRNKYSQDSAKRQCVYRPYKDGSCYSDCSSSILNTYYEAGVLSWHEGNTATIHEKGELVSCQITDGVPDESELRIGDCLLFRGNDPARPLQIGHVEMYAGAGKIYGHGSGTPSEKGLVEYCRNRERQRASNGKSKGLVEIRRFIRDEGWHWVHVGDNWYYQDRDGRNSYGWKDIKETGRDRVHRYYFDTRGTMCKGMNYIDGKTYYLQEYGPLEGALCETRDDDKSLVIWNVG